MAGAAAALHGSADHAARFESKAATREPALVKWAIVGVSLTFFAVFLGYGTQLVAMIGFYIVVSLWFHFWRYRFVYRAGQFTMPWHKPAGY